MARRGQSRWSGSCSCCRSWARHQPKGAQRRYTTDGGLRLHSHLHGLHRLALSHNLIRDQGCKDLFANIIQCTRLDTLDLTDNCIGNEGLAAVASFLNDDHLHLLDDLYLCKQRNSELRVTDAQFENGDLPYGILMFYGAVWRRKRQRASGQGVHLLPPADEEFDLIDSSWRQIPFVHFAEYDFDYQPTHGAFHPDSPAFED